MRRLFVRWFASRSSRRVARAGFGACLEQAIGDGARLSLRAVALERALGAEVQAADASSNPTGSGRADQEEC